MAGDYSYKPIPHGFDIPLSEKELYYLRAAGIAPHMLNNSDRLAVIKALMHDTDLIENPAAGGPLALIYKFGILQAMLQHQAEQAQEEDEEEEEERKKKCADKKKKEEERLLQLEYERYRLQGEQAYLQANPLPLQLLPLDAASAHALSQDLTLSAQHEHHEALSPVAQLLQGFYAMPHTIPIVVEEVADPDPSHLKPPSDPNRHKSAEMPLLERAHEPDPADAVSAPER